MFPYYPNYAQPINNSFPSAADVATSSYSSGLGGGQPPMFPGPQQYPTPPNYSSYSPYSSTPYSNQPAPSFNPMNPYNYQSMPNNISAASVAVGSMTSSFGPASNYSIPVNNVSYGSGSFVNNFYFFSSFL